MNPQLSYRLAMLEESLLIIWECILIKLHFRKPTEEQLAILRERKECVQFLMKTERGKL